MVAQKMNGLLFGVVELILLIGVLSGVTPSVLGYIDNLSATLVANGVGLGGILAVSALGGILWFALCILIVVGVVFLMIKGAKSGGKY